MVSKYFSPKEVARAIGASESSLKRWVDKELINASRTTGGHRRLELAAVLQYLRKSGRSLQHPQSIDLPEECGALTTLTTHDAQQPFMNALIAGSEKAARRVIIDLFVSGASVAEICDVVITPAFQSVGDLWQCGQVKIYEERRVCELCQSVVHELRRIIGTGPKHGPLAMGGTLDGDSNTLPTSLTEVVLCHSGWRATSLGHMFPVETAHSAIVEKRPALFWVSVTTVCDADRLAAEVNTLFDAATSVGTALVVGGQALTADIRQKMRYTQFSDNMSHMELFANSIRPGTSQLDVELPDQD